METGRAIVDSGLGSNHSKHVSILVQAPIFLLGWLPWYPVNHTTRLPWYPTITLEFLAFDALPG